MSDHLSANSGDDDEDVRVNGSVIGTRNYWDECYDRELDNYRQFGDLGEVWFGRHNNRRIIDWICADIGASADQTCHRQVLDIGCGNGYLLVELAKRQPFSRLVGVDYSAKSVEFCRELSAKELSADKQVMDIRFEELDVLNDSLDAKSCLIESKFDYIVDKGTYDAICLMPNADLDHIRDTYRQFIGQLMSDSCVFILMSCNFTRNELLKHFRVDQCFQLVDDIPTPTITFGGRSGSQVTAIILKKLTSL